jgi:hypothetical protein
MSKELTEQWKNGELPDGYYYIDYDTQKRIFEIEDGCATYQGLPAETYFLNDVCLIKVLAPVPSYDKVKELKEDNRFLKSGIETRDKQIELLQEQLKEANEIISYVSRTSNYGPIYEPCYVYCQKWGVK